LKLADKIKVKICDCSKTYLPWDECRKISILDQQLEKYHYSHINIK
jgi:bifunctional pyridoxal-dependent enzyme with beta-cystathionase and maltose regulon repressor activities